MGLNIGPVYLAGRLEHGYWEYVDMEDGLLVVYCVDEEGMPGNKWHKHEIDEQAEKAPFGRLGEIRRRLKALRLW